MTRSNLVTGFSVGKVKTVDFSETIAASDLKFSRSRHLIKYMKIYASIEGQDHFLTLAQGRVHTKIQTGFFRNYCADMNQSLHESFHVINIDLIPKTEVQFYFPCSQNIIAGTV